MLTPKQNQVINCLQNGWSLVTECTIPGATVATTNCEFYIGSRVFWNLVDKGLIAQGDQSQSFCYMLTKAGHEIETKDVQGDFNL